MVKPVFRDPIHMFLDLPDPDPSIVYCDTSYTLYSSILPTYKAGINGQKKFVNQEVYDFYGQEIRFRTLPTCDKKYDIVLDF